MRTDVTLETEFQQNIVKKAVLFTCKREMVASIQILYVNYLMEKF